ncbi:MAG: exodeoxyribonuclease VII large subunit [Lachnospiraceae bacterium]|nr:exodeoxyribonuclease VII large subunit [Lachnospiraceae bacterium]
MMKNVYSVGQVNTYIKNMFAQDFMMQRICVKGEVSNCKYHTSGHIYFTLKDAAGTLNAVMFAGYRRGMKFTMKEGDNVIVTGSVEVYERDGKYQLYAKEIELDGAGNLYLKFEALKQELEEMGMFAPEYKKPIPKFARRVGVVTAPTGAAIQDIRNISSRRNPYVQVILYPALVQGDGAVASIVNGIEALDRMGLDVIIVGRGGGSIEDLWAFNEEEVARAIFQCNTPIISAVGHETDTTIADFVSDMRAPTPSAAAELAVFDYRILKEQLDTMHRRIYQNMVQKVNVSHMRMQTMEMKLRNLSPENRLRENRMYVAELQQRMEQRIQRIFSEKKHYTAILAERMERVSPLRKLSSGYAYVADAEGKAVTSTEQLQCGDELNIHFLNGRVKTEVKEIVNT